MSRWHDGGPPPEAYSRVTNPERFLPLHVASLGLAESLAREFHVRREEGLDLIERKPGVTFVRPSIRLTPRTPEAASIEFSFTDFPGVYLRFGRACDFEFPGCGCDACDETADEEIRKLAELVTDITEGRFCEVADGSRPRWAHWCGGRAEFVGIDSLSDLPSGAIRWQPWPRR